ncbi:ABC transporter substrate-binding protein [Planctomycetota bacterium]
MVKQFRSLGLMTFLVAGGVGLAWLSMKSGHDSNPPAPVHVERVVCMHPAATELFFAMGQQDRLVAVSNFCTVPPEAQDKPSIGDTVNPDLERIRMLHPDLVIVSGEIPTITRFCQTRGLRVENLHMEGIDGIRQGILRLGELLDETERAAALWSEIETQLDAVRMRLAGQAQVSTFFAFYRTPGSLAGMTTAGSGTYIDELITLAGGRNIFADVNTPYPQISKETLVKRQPEVIIEPREQQGLDDLRRAAFRADWQMLTIPVARQRIYFPDQDLVLRPGPRVGYAAYLLAEMIHPECFHE